MDVSSHEGAAGDLIVGGMGGEARQADGRGGRGGLPPMPDEIKQILGVVDRLHMKRPYWDDGEAHYGRGGDMPDTLKYQARRLLVEMIKAEYLRAPAYLTTDVWYERNAVPLQYINDRLNRAGMNWRASVVDYEYVLSDE